jgi:hypothetical protein
VHLTDVGRINRGSDVEVAVYAVLVDNLSSEWACEARVDIAGYDSAANSFDRHDVNGLTSEQARALAWVVEVVGSAELAGLLRQAAALVDEEAGR